MIKVGHFFQIRPHKIFLFELSNQKKLNIKEQTKLLMFFLFFFFQSAQKDYCFVHFFLFINKNKLLPEEEGAGRINSEGDLGQHLQTLPEAAGAPGW